MSVFFGLAYLWWGLLGFISVVLSIILFIGSGAPSARGCWKYGGLPARVQDRKKRNAWLLQHFGEDGRKQWLANEAAKHTGGLVGYLRRLPNGRCVGKVNQEMRNNHADPDNYWTCRWSVSPPWGNDLGKYDSRHKWGGLYGGHEEPTGTDWLAAGFWDPVEVDGHVVDPIAELKEQMVKEWAYGYPTVLFADEKLWDELCAETKETHRKRYGWVRAESFSKDKKAPLMVMLG